MQVGTEQVWQFCDDQGLPRVVVVSRLDRDNANFRQAVEQLREMYGTKVRGGAAAHRRGKRLSRCRGPHYR